MIHWAWVPAVGLFCFSVGLWVCEISRDRRERRLEEYRRLLRKRTRQGPKPEPKELGNEG